MSGAPRVLFVAPELAPWAKAGGLGEVARDRHIVSTYDAARLDAKQPNKTGLRRELGLVRDRSRYARSFPRRWRTGSRPARTFF